MNKYHDLLFVSQRSGNYTNSQSLEYGQRIVASQNFQHDRYESGNDNHYNSDESEYNDPLNGIYSQYYEEEEEDNEPEILKRNSSNQTQIQNPKRQKF